MKSELKTKLKEKVFFLCGAEEKVANKFLDSLPEAEAFSKGGTVCSPQTASKGLGILIKGALEIISGHNCANIRVMDAVEVFGAASLFGGGGYVSTIRASQDAEVIFVSEEALAQLMRDSFRVSQNYITFLSEKVRFLNSRIENFTAGCSAAALWDYLCREADENGIALPPKNMSRLAKTLNMGRTSLYRAVEELEAAGKLKRYEDCWKLAK